MQISDILNSWARKIQLEENYKSKALFTSIFQGPRCLQQGSNSESAVILFKVTLRYIWLHVTVIFTETSENEIASCQMWLKYK